MSEYQYVGFRAIDGPVSGENLIFMNRQSSRAKITPWTFENEYHYGDFHGNAEEMVRRGYDIHLHYANFGIRTLMIRLPHGFPDKAAAKPYLYHDDGLEFIEDKHGPGGILVVAPFYEPGDLEELYNPGQWLDLLVPLRSEILDGDLRPLYLLHLAMSMDMNHDPDETVEAPVPAGLKQSTKPQRDLAEFCDIGGSVFTAAASKSPLLPATARPSNQFGPWVARLPEQTKNDWLTRILEEPSGAVRTDMLARFSEESETTAWPTVNANRTMTELLEAAEELDEKEVQEMEVKAARERAKLLQDMATDPIPYLRQTEDLVAQRSTDAYKQIAEILADLREALADTDQSELADQHAWKLKADHPTLHVLTRALRDRGFVPKSKGG